MPAQASQLIEADVTSADIVAQGLTGLLRTIGVSMARYGVRPSTHQHSGDLEEILLDVELDGARYLLIRLPKPQGRIQLSPRELEIVRMVAEGHPNKAIAGVLNISCWTVATHLRRIFAKLGVNSRAAMVARMPEIGWTRESLTRSAIGGGV